jgi:hypothetical protein
VNVSFCFADPCLPSELYNQTDSPQEELSRNINERVTKGMQLLQQKHATGTNELDPIYRAPTGPAYRHIEQMELQQRVLQQHAADQQRHQLQARAQKQQEDDDEEDYDYLLDDDKDGALEELRQKRIQEMKQEKDRMAVNIAKGHGQYRTISQDEFLSECTTDNADNSYVVVHFYHPEYERCRVMDHHLKIIAQLHVECKFLRIDATKAPFFCFEADDSDAADATGVLQRPDDSKIGGFRCFMDEN